MVLMPLFTRFTRGVARVGPVPLDVEVSTQVSQSATFSDRRIADGSFASDHSQNEPDEIVISGVVDSMSPIVGVGAAALTTGRFMQWERLHDLIRSRDELEIVCARGKFRVTARSLTVKDDASTGVSSQFTMTCKQVLRGRAKVITVPTDQSLALVGPGGGKALGPTSTTEVTL